MDLQGSSVDGRKVGFVTWMVSLGLSELNLISFQIRQEGDESFYLEWSDWNQLIHEKWFHPIIVFGLFPRGPMISRLRGLHAIWHQLIMMQCQSAANSNLQLADHQPIFSILFADTNWSNKPCVHASVHFASPLAWSLPFSTQERKIRETVTEKTEGFWKHECERCRGGLFGKPMVCNTYHTNHCNVGGSRLLDNLHGVFREEMSGVISGWYT